MVETQLSKRGFVNGEQLIDLVNLKDETGYGLVVWVSSDDESYYFPVEVLSYGNENNVVRTKKIWGKGMVMINAYEQKIYCELIDEKIE